MVDSVYTVSGYGFCSSSILSFATTNQDDQYIENDAGIPIHYEIPTSSFYNRVGINATLDKIKNN